MEHTSCLICKSDQHRHSFQTKAMMHPTPERFTFVECAQCGLIYLNPRVPMDQIGRYYSNSYLPYLGAEAWGKYKPWVDIGQRQTDRKRVAVVKQYYSFKQNSHVLDLGCGKPTFLRMLQEQTNCQAFGLDFKANGWSHTNEFATVDLREGTLYDTTYAEKFNVITLWHYLEHDYDPVSTLQRLKQLAAPEARLFIEVPNYDSISRKKQGIYWEGFHTPRHTAVYSPATLAKLLAAAGWRVVKQYTHGTMNPYALWWMGKQEQKNINWSESMDSRFPGFMLGQIAWTPLLAMQRFISLGIQLTIAEPA